MIYLSLIRNYNINQIEKLSDLSNKEDITSLFILISQNTISSA
jgi:hypothetical protein